MSQALRAHLAAARAQAPALWLIAVFALLPFSRSYELPLLVMAVLGAKQVPALFRAGAEPMQGVAALLFLGYWLPELLSALDSVAASKSWTEVAVDLRFLPALLYAQRGLSRPGAAAFALRGLGLLVALWTMDALVQAVAGVSLGGSNRVDRLSGIFGDDDLKLGAVMAALSPLLLVAAKQRFGWRGFALSALALAMVIGLAGARAAWLSYALVLALMLWFALPRLSQRLAALAVACVLLLGAGLVLQHSSQRFAERIDRSAAALAGDPAALDHALSFRLPIWRAAQSMFTAHPINGVGVRGYRYAYPDHAPSDDRFLFEGERGEQGAFHAHQIVLEILSETGTLGLLCWLGAVACFLRALRAAPVEARDRAWPASLALLALLFPLNTHYAVYSSFLSVLLFALLALWLGALSTRAPTVR
ncbi:O-antigen ligase family protein [Aquimonas voraii]|uniref:O-antigen ligase n=1 Tax=Aquimonas voraii TaxID=265719 RepID=A0A1G6YN64_9GAMM|nr:O-antigen ligase family protein [Aquimonas voraii]SDD91964.1 O-antigen ligase [Aquimonas voraii]